MTCIWRNLKKHAPENKAVLFCKQEFLHTPQPAFRSSLPLTRRLQERQHSIPWLPSRPWARRLLQGSVVVGAEVVVDHKLSRARLRTCSRIAFCFLAFACSNHFHQESRPIPGASITPNTRLWGRATQHFPTQR